MEGENRYDRVSRAIERILESQPATEPQIVNTIFFGEEDPDELVIYLAYADAKSHKAAEQNGLTERITDELMKALVEEGYPERPVEIIFISEEEVDKSGGPFKYFR